MPAVNCLSATALAKKTAVTLDSLEKSETGKLIILKDNMPKAVLLSFDAYEALEEELEDLRLAAHAYTRQKTFRSETARSHKDMMERFGG